MSKEKIALIVMCSSRPEALKNHLDQILKIRPQNIIIPIFISQDGIEKSVTDIALKYKNEDDQIHFIQVFVFYLQLLLKFYKFSIKNKRD